MSTFMASAESAAAGTRWHIIDADGQVLGLLSASRMPLQGALRGAMRGALRGCGARQSAGSSAGIRGIRPDRLKETLP